MDDSDSSSLSSAPEEEVQKLAPIFLKAKKATKQAYPPPAPSSPRPKRPPSPPHEEVLADNPDIAFVVIFRSRFSDAFSSKLPHFGPQDIERGVVDSVPTPQIESLLCALLALVLNRKKPVERGHHGRALEEAVLSQKTQWPHKWAGVNPLHGNRDFRTMSPSERLDLLRTLVLWSLTSSEAIQTIIKEKYKQQRHMDDENQPLSVQPWGMDGDKRRYFLIQGQDDTGFRVYREGSRHTKNAHWYSMAGSIDEAKALAKKLEDTDGTQAARRLATKINNAIPMFEATEEKRRRREYRQIRRAAFTRPEPGFSLYEGRTRGKRMQYNYYDDDAFDSDATSTRRSTRQSGRNTPFEPGPEYTASGRQVKKPRTGDYGESLLSNNVTSTDELAPEFDDRPMSRHEGSDSSEPVRVGARATRSVNKPSAGGASAPRKRKHIDGYNDIDDMSEEEDATPSADEWDSDKDHAEDEHIPDADDEDENLSDEEGEEEDEGPDSLVVRLKLSTEALLTCDAPPRDGATRDPDLHAATGAGAGPPPAEPPEPPLPNGYTTTAAAPSPAPQPRGATPPSASAADPTPASTSFAEQKHTLSARPPLDTAPAAQPSATNGIHDARPI